MYEEWTDPPGIKLRPAQGLVAADYLVADYWVWAKVIEVYYYYYHYFCIIYVHQFRTWHFLVMMNQICIWHHTTGDFHSKC